MEVDPVHGSDRLPTFPKLNPIKRLTVSITFPFETSLTSDRKPMLKISRTVLMSILMGGAVMTVSMLGCNALTWTGTHHGVRYSIHRDLRNHSIVKGKDGSLMYDSTELTVLSENGRLMINGVESGTVSEGDLVEVTSLGTVLVNGQRRGDKLTGNAAMQERLNQTKTAVETHSQAELDYRADHG